MLQNSVMAIHDYTSIKNYLGKLSKGVDKLCVKKVRIENQFSGAAADFFGGNNQSDIFTLLLCIAGETVKWQILFDAFNVQAGPDVLILNNSNEINDFDPEYEKIESLAKWDGKNENSLMIVLEELIGAYKQHQLSKCREIDTEIYKQIAQLVDFYDKVELSVCNSDKSGRCINVMIEIKLEIQTDDDDDEKKTDVDVDDVGGMMTNDWVLCEPVLLIKYDMEQDRRSPIIYLPPAVDKMIGGRQTLTPPSFTHEQQLLTYVHHVHEQMRNYTSLLVESDRKRREFVRVIIDKMPGRMLEFDATNFLKMSLLFSVDGFLFTVHVLLSRTFPREQPVLTFESSLHLNKRHQLFQMTCNNYHYNPRWSPPEIAHNLRSLVMEKSQLFKEKSEQQGVLAI